MTSRNRLAAAVLIVAAAGILAVAAPGHRMLYRLGFTAACDGGDCN